MAKSQKSLGKNSDQKQPAGGTKSTASSGGKPKGAAKQITVEAVTESGKVVVKNPFEKLMTQREVKSLLRHLLTDGKELYCKGEDDVFFGFRPDDYDDDLGLAGKIVVLDAKPQGTENVVVNFAKGAERFFTLATFTTLEGRGILTINRSIYRLERREHLRIPLIDDIEKSCNIIEWQKKIVFSSSEIMDISQGGVRLAVPASESRPSAIGDRVKIVLHIKKKWRIELMADIRHVSSAPGQMILGLQFDLSNENDFRKVLSVTMELQREFVRKENAV